MKVEKAQKYIENRDNINAKEGFETKNSSDTGK